MDGPYEVYAGSEGNRIFGTLLQHQRLMAQIDPNSLAEIVGVHVSFVRGIERGAQAPSFTTGMKLLEAVGARFAPAQPGVDLLVEVPKNGPIGFIFKARVKGQNRRPEVEAEKQREQRNKNDEIEIRIEALRQANLGKSEHNTTAIIERAKLFETYLRGER